MTSFDPFPSVDDLPTLDLTLLGAAGSGADAARARAIEDGRAQGFAMGAAEGRVAALAEGRSAVAHAAEALDAAAQHLLQRDALAASEMADQIVALALGIAEAVIGRELDSAIDPGRDALARALQLAPDRGAMVARLHPADAEVLAELDDLAPGRELAVVSDPLIEPGGCVLEVGPARIDAQLGAAIERVRSQLWALDADEVAALLDDEVSG